MSGADDDATAAAAAAAIDPEKAAKAAVSKAWRCEILTCDDTSIL